MKILPDKNYGISVAINSNEFIVPLHDALLKYDVRQGHWSEYSKYPQSLIDILTTSYDIKNKLLFVTNSTKVLTKININTNQCQSLSLPRKYKYKTSSLIRSNLHLFATLVQDRFSCKKQRLHHTIINTKLSTFTEIDTSNIDIVCGAGTI